MDPDIIVKISITANIVVTVQNTVQPLLALHVLTHLTVLCITCHWGQHFVVSWAGCHGK